VEYPIGSTLEHLFGGGIWVGGKLDTSQGGTSPAVTVVSTAYEGWTGPYFEFFPGSTPADTIWKVQGRGVPRPSGWEFYWGDLIPRLSFSDNDHYLLYDDAHVNASGHVPLRLKVAQSCYVWQDPYADAIHIIDYKLVNIGTREVDSAYVGVFLDADVGSCIGVPNYSQNNYTGYYPDSRTGFVHNPIDFGSTPIGLSLIDASEPIAPLRFSYRWWTGPTHPATNTAKYALLSSGRIDSNQSLSTLSDARFMISVGPFTLLPEGAPGRDTLRLVFALVSGENLAVMRRGAVRAQQIYLNGGQVSVGYDPDDRPSRYLLSQNFPNPFNPSTRLTYELPGEGKVQLIVYDLLGRAVATLVNDTRQAGRHTLDFTPANLSSGVYFCRLQAGGYVKTMKMMYVR
jgi:hypothetical protein